MYRKIPRTMAICVRIRVAFIEKHRSNPCSQACAQGCTSVADEGRVDVKAHARRDYEKEKITCVRMLQFPIETASGFGTYSQYGG